MSFIKAYGKCGVAAKAVSLLLVFTVIVAVLGVYADSFIKANAEDYVPSGTYMMYSPGRYKDTFGQYVELEKGKTYQYSFAYNYERFTKANKIAAMIKCVSTSGDEATVTKSELAEDNNYNRQIWEFSVPGNAVPEANGKYRFMIGVYFGERGQKGYFCDFRLFDTEDTAKNILVNGDFEKGFYGWFGAGMNKNNPISEIGVTSLKSKEELKSFDIEIFKRPTEVLNEKKMLKISAKAAESEFGQWVELETGKAYIYTVIYKNENNAQTVTPEIGCFIENSYEQSVDIYDMQSFGDKFVGEFEMPSDSTALESGKRKAFIKISVKGNGKEAFACGFSLVEKSDSTKRELLTNADFSKGLYGWTCAGSGRITAGNVLKSPTEQVELVTYDSGKFEIKDSGDVTQREYMMSLLGKTSGSYCGQWVELERGKTYRYSFLYNYQRFEWGNKITAAIRCIPSSGTEAQVAKTELKEDKDCYRQNWEFTVPDDAKAESNGKYRFLIGIYCGVQGQTGNFCDFSLVDVDDGSKENLLKNADFKEGFKHWFGDISHKPVTEDKVTLLPTKNQRLVTKDPELFKKPVISESTEKKMIYAVGSDGATEFGQWLELERGKTYIYSITYRKITGSISAFPQIGCFSGNKWKYDLEVIDTIVDGNTTTFVFNTDNADLLANGKSNIYIKLTLSKSGGAMYAADFVVKEKDNANAENLLTNPDFSMGLYGWSCAGNGRVREANVYESPITQVKVIPYDVMNFVDDSSDEAFLDEGWEAMFSPAKPSDDSVNEQPSADNNGSSDIETKTGDKLPLVVMVCVSLAVGAVLVSIKYRHIYFKKQN